MHVGNTFQTQLGPLETLILCVFVTLCDLLFYLVQGTKGQKFGIPKVWEVEKEFVIVL